MAPHERKPCRLHVMRTREGRQMQMLGTVRAWNQAGPTL